MQESWEFNLPENPDDGPDAASITRLLKENDREMGIFLSYYYRGEGGLVEAVKPDKIDFTSATSGTVSVSFKVVHFNACLDIHDQEKENMSIQFTLDTAGNKLKLTGPRWPQ